ncbi:hypothetical protein JOF28_001940 [Leucobacter exalbidus]|uniref:Peptidase_C39 like family protein n=1 Tax=Leucobacter exalbidus TaxID=662960 RepID=A0A940PP21_9MICO|nr:peptidase C39 family protein [Leucobacter exalbidus]MBP1326708.1 hypothetical protein [Leucobacter exalbidus]
MTTHEIHVTDGALAPEAITSEARATLWSTPRELWAPRTVRVHEAGATQAEPGRVVASTLTAGRPHTSARKIVDVFADTDEAFRDAVAAAVADRGFVSDTRPEPIVIKFEEHPGAAPLTEAHAEILADLGFVRDVDPVPSVESTRPGSATHARGWSKWLGAAPTRRAPYYGQTTDVTCGAVTSLMMFEGAGLTKFGADGDANQSRELSFWRRATNMPACEPVGLAVATAEEITATGVTRGLPRVILSAEDLVLLEWYADQPHEYRLREQLQRDSQRAAKELGVEIERRWVPVEEIAELVAEGSDVFLLIDLDPLIGDPTPHWVLAHDVIGDALIVSDPWVESEQGETWVDTSEMPMPFSGVDLVTRWGDPAYRGVIVVPRG